MIIINLEVIINQIICMRFSVCYARNSLLLIVGIENSLSVNSVTC
jgi:hypothetical protein